MTIPPRIVIADDHRLFRMGIKTLMENDCDCLVVGEAENGVQALEMTAETRPDLVLLDVGMRGLNGIETARRLRTRHPGVKILVLTMFNDSRTVVKALRAGASGYLLKDCSSTELCAAIHAVMAGQAYLSPEIARIVMRLGPEEARADSPELALLTTREREILQLVAEGLSSREIASRLELSPRTVETHRQRIMDKLHLKSVASLTKFAIREGLTDCGR